MRVLEIGGAPGAAARAVVELIGPSGHVMVLDRSARGIALTRAKCADYIAAGSLSTLRAEVEDFRLPDGAEPFDLAFACRVGALDGRHPALYSPALSNISAVLTPSGRLFADIQEPVVEVKLVR